MSSLCFSLIFNFNIKRSYSGKYFIIKKENRFNIINVAMSTMSTLLTPKNSYIVKSISKYNVKTFFVKDMEREISIWHE